MRNNGTLPVLHKEFLSELRFQDFSFRAAPFCHVLKKLNFSTVELRDGTKSHAMVIIGTMQKRVSRFPWEEIRMGRDSVWGWRTLEAKRQRIPWEIMKARDFAVYVLGWIVLGVCSEDTFPLLWTLTLAEFSLLFQRNEMFQIRRTVRR